MKPNTFDWAKMLGDLGFVTAFDVALDDFYAAVKIAGDDVPVVEEGVLFTSDIDKGRFQAVFKIADTAFEDAANKPLLGGPLDVEFLEAAFL